MTLLVLFFLCMAAAAFGNSLLLHIGLLFADTEAAITRRRLKATGCFVWGIAFLAIVAVLLMAHGLYLAETT